MNNKDEIIRTDAVKGNVLTFKLLIVLVDFCNWRTTIVENSNENILSPEIIYKTNISILK